jgi:hypothetical protein
MIWEQELWDRLDNYSKATKLEKGNALPLSIKIRVTAGCFHREHSPEAYTIIDEFYSQNTDKSIKLVEHENGPELLVYLAFTTAVLSLSAQTINFVSTIIKARSEGVKKGDMPNESIELIVRGFDKKGKIKEEKVLKINSTDKISNKNIDVALKHVMKKFIE